MDQDLIMLIGRLEGKLDALVSLQPTQNERLGNLELRTASVETRVTVMETTSSSNRSWWASLTALLVAIVTALASLFGGYFNPH